MVSIFIFVFQLFLYNDLPNQLLAGNQHIYQSKKDQFNEFLKTIGKIRVPIQFTCSISPKQIEGIPARSLYDHDNVFTKGKHYIYGQLMVERNYKLILYGLISDDVYPLLITYDPNGTKIDSLLLVSNNCGAASDSEIITSRCMITRDLHITLIDSVAYFHSVENEESLIIDSSIVKKSMYQIDSFGYIKRKI